MAIILSIRIMKNILITRRDCNLAVISDITSQDDTIYIDKALLSGGGRRGGGKMEILIIYCDGEICKGSHSDGVNLSIYLISRRC